LSRSGGAIPGAAEPPPRDGTSRARPRGSPNPSGGHRAAQAVQLVADFLAAHVGLAELLHPHLGQRAAHDGVRGLGPAVFEQRPSKSSRSMARCPSPRRASGKSGTTSMAAPNLRAAFSRSRLRRALIPARWWRWARSSCRALYSGAAQASATAHANEATGTIRVTIPPPCGNEASVPRGDA